MVLQKKDRGFWGGIVENDDKKLGYKNLGVGDGKRVKFWHVCYGASPLSHSPLCSLLHGFKGSLSISNLGQF